MDYKKIKINNKKNRNKKIDDTILIIPSNTFDTLVKETQKKYNIKSNSFFDISLKNFVLTLVYNFKEITNELISVIYNKNIIIEDEQFTGENNDKSIFFKLFIIFTKESRLIYNGFFLIIIAFFIYFIDITS